MPDGHWSVSRHEVESQREKVAEANVFLRKPRPEEGVSRKDLLIVADDPLMCLSLKERLIPEGYAMETALDVVAALARLKEDSFQVILADLQMSGLSVIEFLKEVQGRFPDTLLVFIAGPGQMDGMVEAIKLGAYEYLTKPMDDLRLKLTLKRAMEQRRLLASLESLQRRLKPWEQDEKLVSRDPSMGRLLKLAHTIADTEATVLITGESGTGKSLLARYVHDHSARRSGPFVKVTCGSLPENLLERELFGQTPGDGSGRKGKFAEAQGGTIFLDDINYASHRLQLKLLRVLQERVMERVGGETSIPVDVRLIAATDTSLQEEVVRQKFREDLFRCLNVACFTIPPLRERLGDVEPLCEHFLHHFNRVHHKQIKGISRAALQLCLRYPWPGNIQELENVMERAVILSPGEFIVTDSLPAQLQENGGRYDPPAADLTLNEALARYEKQILLDNLERFKWNRQLTARALGISRTTLFNKMRHFKFLEPRR